jgi:hypothetical protein
MVHRFGSRKSNKLGIEDIVAANRFAGTVQTLLKNYGVKLGLEVTEDYPEPLPYPCPGKNPKAKGEILMEYTLFYSRKAFELLKVAHQKKGFIYKIEELPRKPQDVYYASVAIIGQQPTSVVVNDYFQALSWIMEKLVELLARKV